MIFGAEFHFQESAERQVPFGDKNTHGCSNERGNNEGMFNLVKRHARVKQSSLRKFGVSRNEKCANTLIHAKSDRALG
jgi:hypothetical protein